MPQATPRYLLISAADRAPRAARWRFVLQPLEANEAPSMEAADCEPDVYGERLELLAVVRGLEALDQPSHVTLLTTSRYVSRGLNYGLHEWRCNGWQWEHFGVMTPIKNRDLWQRLDRALQFHQVDCRLLRVDLAHALSGKTVTRENPHFARPSRTETLQGPHFLRKRLKTSGAAACGVPVSSTHRAESHGAKQQKTIVGKRVRFADRWCKLGSTIGRKRTKLRIRVMQQFESWGLRFRQFGTGLAPPPWLDR